MGPKTKAALREYQKAMIDSQQDRAWYSWDDNSIIDNVFPYGYSDDSDNRAWGVVKKGWTGLTGLDERRRLLNEFVQLDLDTPEGMARARELRPIFDNNFKNQNISLRYLQQSARARYDLNNLYLKRPQIFFTYMVNPDYKSPSAENGQPTYTYRDPSLRRYQQSLARTYGLKNGVGVHNVVGDATTTYNTYAINTMHPDGSGRWGDIWDFELDDVYPRGTPVIVGDTVPSTAPIQPAVYIRKSTDRDTFDFMSEVKKAVKKFFNKDK